MNPSLDKEFVAVVLIEAAYTTDEQACEKYGISKKSLQRYRKALANDPELSTFVRTKKELIDRAWADELRVALHRGIRTLSECMAAISADVNYKKNPMVVSAVAGAIKLCAEVEMTGKLIDARITPTDRPQDSIPGQGDTETPKPLIN